jgi:hypothetical protein
VSFVYVYRGRLKPNAAWKGKTWEEWCTDADARRVEIKRNIETIEKNPLSRNTNGTLYAELLTLKAELTGLPNRYDIDRHFTLEPASGAIKIDDILKPMGSKRDFSGGKFREDWYIHALLRGIGVHHGQLHSTYRNAVEFMFRKGQLAIVFATSTLAQVSCCCITAIGGGFFLRLSVKCILNALGSTGAGVVAVV